MRISIITILLISCAFLCASNISAQRQETAVKARLIDYLTGVCAEGNEVTFKEFVAKNESVVASDIVGFANNGVPKRLIAKMDASAQKLFADRQEILAEERDLGLSKENLAILKKESSRDFTKRMVTDFEDGFMNQNIMALSWLSAQNAKDLLHRISSDSTHRYQRAASRALSGNN